MRLTSLVWITAVLIGFSLGVQTGYDVGAKRKPAAAPVFQSCGPTHVMRIGDGVLRVVTDVSVRENF